MDSRGVKKKKVEFETELSHDVLTVDGVDYSGLDSPHLVEVAASSPIIFTSDWGTTHMGWKMCTDNVSTTDGIFIYAVGRSSHQQRHRRGGRRQGGLGCRRW